MKWRLWHGRVDGAIRDLEQLLARLKDSQRDGEFSIARLFSLASQLLTYVHSNRGAIVNYGKRYRAGLRVASALAESAVNSLVGKRMVKKQQMRRSSYGAHMLMQVRTAEINCELRDRLGLNNGRTFGSGCRKGARSIPREITGLIFWRSRLNLTFKMLWGWRRRWHFRRFQPTRWRAPCRNQTI